MSHMTEEVCLDYLYKLSKAKSDTLTWPADYSCKCSESAEGVQGTLLNRMRCGDDSALDELLGYYDCLNKWVKEVIEEAEWRCVAQAMVKNTMMDIPEGSFPVNLRLALIEAAIEIYTTRLEQIRAAMRPYMSATFDFSQRTTYIDFGLEDETKETLI